MEYLYGQVTEKISPVYYKGINGVGTTITIDNAKRTITVDINDYVALLNRISTLESRVTMLEESIK